MELILCDDDDTFFCLISIKIVQASHQYTTSPLMSHIALTVCPSPPPPRSGPVCRAVLAAPGTGWQEAGSRGKSSLAAQHWLRRSCGGHSLQDGFPTAYQVNKKLVVMAIHV